MSKAISIYANGLGLKILKQYGNHYAQISTPGIIIGLHPSNGRPNSSENISIGFTVNNFMETKNRLKELAIQHHERTEEGVKFIHFKDPD